MRKIISFVLALIMVAGLLPAMALTAGATAPIPYLDANGVTQICDDYTLYTGQTTLTSGWYVVNGTQVASERITFQFSSDKVHIILTDGSHLDASNGGIRTQDINSLTIYAQSTGGSMGRLTADNPGNNNAGIGGNNLRGGIITISKRLTHR
jgi:hypothetical protein